MNLKKTATTAWEDPKVGVKQQLALLWTSFMFLYLYADYFALYMPGKIPGILKGSVYAFEITEGFLLAALISVCLPALMIFLSVALPAKLNRPTNLIMSTVYIPCSLFNLAGEAWMHMLVGTAVEVGLLCLIIVTLRPTRSMVYEKKCYGWI